MSLASEFTARHGELVRLTVLQLLGELSSNSAIEELILPPIEAMDLPCTMDQLRGHLSWLAEQGLIEIENNKRGGLTAYLLERGREVARGAATAPGVARAKLRG
ncbi:VpaChn25_0724 family phage protein [Novosphingobium naphthalenivorans]|uniref:VpaChn25_0724 family phage protein n=1 Tax=Novosphingobium naphthalenivorans TaxID=273168 RepID=UPI000836275E|nr:hypothetical protein [Novosphingobium naphthalenivorans]